MMVNDLVVLDSDDLVRFLEALLDTTKIALLRPYDIRPLLSQMRRTLFDAWRVCAIRAKMQKRQARRQVGDCGCDSSNMMPNQGK